MWSVQWLHSWGSTGETGACSSLSNGALWLIGNSLPMVATTANSRFTKSVFLEQVATMGSLPMEAKYH